MQFTDKGTRIVKPLLLASPLAAYNIDEYYCLCIV